MRFLVLLFSLSLLMTPGIAQDNKAVVNKSVVVQTVVKPSPGSISHNVVFVVDASSTMNDEPEMQKKWQLAWDTIVNRFASDELYCRVIIFSDRRSERFFYSKRMVRKKQRWFDAGGPLGMRKFEKVRGWILENTGSYSWGLKAFRMAFRQKSTMDRNPATKGRLTIVLLTDGGFTEAAGNQYSDKKKAADEDERALSGKYVKTGSFDVFDKAIVRGQEWRKKKELPAASIVTVGIQNDDPDWGTGVKRPDSECQAWLRKTGEKYGGGYLFVKRAPKKEKAK